MNCTTARELFPALLDARTAATEHLDARAHLAGCPDCQREFAALRQTLSALDAMPTPQPSPRLRQNFYAMLEEEKHSAASVRAATLREQQTRHARVWRWILIPSFGCALLLLGFYGGTRLDSPAIAPAPQFAGTTQSELTALRQQMAEQRDQIAKQNEQLNKMTTLIGYSILQQQQNPTNERLNEVLAAARADNPTDETLDNLLRALAFDPNTNVRLRALQALYPHAERELVRSGVLAAFPREQNPLVQLELIDFLAASRSQEAQPVLERMAQNQTIDLTVREAAKRALAQLTLSTTDNPAPATNGSSVLN